MTGTNVSETRYADRLAALAGEVFAGQDLPGRDGWFRAEAAARAGRLGLYCRRQFDRMIVAAGIDRPEALKGRAQMTLLWLSEYDVTEGIEQLLIAVRDAAFALGWKTLDQLLSGGIPPEVISNPEDRQAVLLAFEEGYATGYRDSEATLEGS